MVNEGEGEALPYSWKQTNMKGVAKLEPPFGKHNNNN